MANDDGKEVRIDSQVVFRGFDGVWKHYVRVCNLTNTPRDLWITTWPYDDKIGKIGQKKGVQITLAPNSCQIVVFDIGGKPTQYYTDVYEYNPLGEFSRYHYVIDSARVIDIYPIYRDILQPLGVRICTVSCALPYPRSLEAGGLRRQFYVRGVRGLPAGWRVRNIWPARGENFALTPDQKEFSCRLELTCGPRPAAAVTPVSIEVGIRGKPFRPPYMVRVALPFVRKERAPVLAELRTRREADRPYLRFVARVTDALGLLDAPELVYSVDEGRTWRTVVMELREMRAMDSLGAKDAVFAGTAALPALKSTVLAKIRCPDQIGNVAESPTRVYRA